MFTYISLKNKNRFVKFPYPVEDIGYLTHYRTAPESYCYSNLEVCIRFFGDENCAVDTVDGQTYRTPYPHVIFKMPGHHHLFHANDHREALFFIYSESTAAELAKADFLPDSLIYPLSLTSEVNNWIRRLKYLMAVSEESAAADKIDLTCFAILEELFYQRKMNCDAVQSKIQQIASFLQMNAGTDLDLRKIAEDHGLSERSFYRHWENQFAVTPAQYVMDQKMKRASWLLIHTSMSIREIASLLHFCDDNYFSTRFRNRFGVSPKQYRSNSMKK